ncbi:MAG: pilus assembly protein PilM [Candidatus Sumerlaeota bacterium]|nr:pilus assembly protein PilM [Candidatus Sumerlaeota bacterium]
MGRTGKSILMLDVGGRQARWARAERRMGGWRIAQADAAALPLGENTGEQRRLALRAALAKAWTDAGRPAPRVLVALPKSLVFLRVYDMPKVARKELRDMLGLRVAQEISHFTDQTVAWDFEILRDAPAEGQQRVVVAAVRRDTLRDFLADFEAVGIQPDVVDIQPLALMRWYLAGRRPGAPSEAALVDFGEAGASIGFVKRGRLANFGQTPITASEIRHAGEGAGDRFVLELQTVMRAALDGQDAEPLSEIICCGGRDLQTSLVEPIRRQMGAEARHISECVAQSDGMLASRSSQLDGQTHVLEGLLYRATARTGLLLDLAPREERVSLAGAAWARLTSLPALVLYVVALVVALYLGGQSVQRHRLEAVDGALRKVSGDNFPTDLMRLENTLNVLRAFEGERFSWMAILTEWNEKLPKTVTLTSLKMERKGKITASGVVTGDKPIQTVKEFETKLNEPGSLFTDAKLGTVRPRKDSAVFDLTCTLASAKKAAPAKSGVAKGK